MEGKERKFCTATLIIGDDYGDNACTFHCQHPEWHSGRHREIFRNGKARIEWTGDDGYERWQSDWILTWDNIGFCTVHNIFSEEEYDRFICSDAYAEELKEEKEKE